MKKFSTPLMAIATLLFSTTLTAQDAVSRVNFGFKISPNFSWLKITEGDIMENDDIGLGFSYGLTGDYRFSSSENYLFGADLLVSTAPINIKHAGKLQRSVSDTTQIYQNVNFRYAVQYLQIPLYIKLKSNRLTAKSFVNIKLSLSLQIFKCDCHLPKNKIIEHKIKMVLNFYLISI
jgi:hypothetical protein